MESSEHINTKQSDPVKYNPNVLNFDNSKIKKEENDISKLQYICMMYLEDGIEAIDDILLEPIALSSYNYIAEKIQYLEDTKIKFEIGEFESNQTTIEHLLDLLVINKDLDKLDLKFINGYLTAMINETLVKYTFIQICLNNILKEYQK